MSERALTLPRRDSRVILLLAVIGGLPLCQALLPAAQALARLLPACPASQFASALDLFLYGTLKVLPSAVFHALL